MTNHPTDQSEARAREVLAGHGIEIGHGGTMMYRANVVTGTAILSAMLAFAARPVEEVERLREALEPVMHWYQSDEHEARPLWEIIADVIADLQADRGAALKLSALATQPATGGTMGEDGIHLWQVRGPNRLLMWETNKTGGQFSDPTVALRAALQEPTR